MILGVGENFSSQKKLQKKMNVRDNFLEENYLFGKPIRCQKKNGKNNVKR